MNIALIMTAVKHGAVVANYTEVVKLLKDPSGKLNGARMRDNLTGKEWDVKAKVRAPMCIFHLSIQLHILSRE
jgi:glycerol-3-phosphate dehydrogenase